MDEVEAFVRRHLAKGGWWRFRHKEAAAAWRLVLEDEALWRTRRNAKGESIAQEFALIGKEEQISSLTNRPDQ